LNTFITILLGFFLIMPPCFAVGLNVRFKTACARGDLEGMKKALEQGASINGKDKKDRSCLHLAARAGHIYCVMELVDSGAVLELTNKLGHTPLYLAASRGHASTVLYLVARGADPTRKERHGECALHAASKSGSMEALNAMLWTKPLLDMRDDAGNTPQEIATIFGHHHIVERLAEAEAANYRNMR